MNHFDVIIIGAGAAGLMCAIEAGKRGRRVLVLDHANKVGKKILMSGGGRCNFTNYTIEPRHYLSTNPHFCKSALKRYTSSDFIDLVNTFNIPYHEKSHGQLFCDNKASDIVAMLLAHCEKNNVTIRLNTAIKSIQKNTQFIITLESKQQLSTASLVVATGGLSIPTMGASPFGYQLATQFGIPIITTRAGLVPFTLQPHDKTQFSDLSGISLPIVVECNKQTFELDMLFTHRGLSGPAMLQISSYWNPADILTVNLDVDKNWLEILKNKKKTKPNQTLKNALEELIPKRVLVAFFPSESFDGAINTYSDGALTQIIGALQRWQIKPNGTEGYRTAEVTLGGVDTDYISSQTMETKSIPGLFFIGEVLDVSGWLGGYNFQWAWSSGWVAGQVV